jgi:hypothetical protein
VSFDDGAQYATLAEEVGRGGTDDAAAADHDMHLISFAVWH